MSPRSRSAYALQTRPPAMTSLRVPVDPHRDHIKGPPAAMLSLVEYADFQCRHSELVYWVLKQLHHRIADLQIVFRRFPLGSIHRRAGLMAEAAQAAGAQGRFWQMHDLLFENQDVLHRRELLACARTLPLEIHTFEAALATHALLPHIREDFFGGVRSGVDRTPCLFINGRRHDGPADLYSHITCRECARHDLDVTVP